MRHMKPENEQSLKKMMKGNGTGRERGARYHDEGWKRREGRRRAMARSLRSERDCLRARHQSHQVLRVQTSLQASARPRITQVRHDPRRASAPRMQTIAGQVTPKKRSRFFWVAPSSTTLGLSLLPCAASHMSRADSH